MIAFLGVLALVAQLLVLAWVVLRLGELATRGRWRPLDRIGRAIAGDSLKLAWLVAAIAMAGSLYFSEVKHFTPCVLCWYQRIAMYPLVAILGVAAVRGDHAGARWYALPLVLAGGLVSVYHYQLERFPEQETIACTTDVPCTTIWFEQFGYITIPMMALSAFALIAVILITSRRGHGQGITSQA